MKNILGLTFTQQDCQPGFYPSVRSLNCGFNIAMSPNIVNKYLRLENVVTMRFYYKDGIGALDFEKYSETFNNGDSFNLKSINDPEITKGQELSYKIIDNFNKNL